MVMAADDDSKPIQEVLSTPILLSDRVIKSAREAESFKEDNLKVGNQVNELSQLLRKAARLISASPAVYERPVRCMAAEVTKALDRALTLARKCRYKRTDVLHCVLSITTAADFKKVTGLLESSLANVNWIISILNEASTDGAFDLTLPPMAGTDPILACVWWWIAALYTGRADAANALADLARDRDNQKPKRVIVEENGIPVLLKMLRESENVDALSASASALCNLADGEGCSQMIVEASGVRIIVKALSKAPMRVQVTLVKLISRMLEVDARVREEFGKEDVMVPLVILLGRDVNLKEFKEASSHTNEGMKTKGEIDDFGGDHCSHSNMSHSNQTDKDEEESQEVRLLKESCASTLGQLARGSALNSKKITGTKALLVLAKMIERETGALKMNCLTVVKELAKVAEEDYELRHTAFKPSSTAANLVFVELLNVINKETNVSLVILAIEALGCLALVFSAKEKLIIGILVNKLSHSSPNVTAEAVKALCKFVTDKNYNHKANSQTIIEYDGVHKIMALLGSKEHAHLHQLLLLCHLARNAGNSKELEQAGALSMLEVAAQVGVAHNPPMRELFAKAIHQLTIFQAGDHMIEQV